MKTSENDVQYSNFYMGGVDKSRELYSKEGDNSSQFEGKTVVWEHTIQKICYFIAAAEVCSINVRETEIKACRLSCDKAVEPSLSVHNHFRLLTVITWAKHLQAFPYLA